MIVDRNDLESRSCRIGPPDQRGRRGRAKRGEFLGDDRSASGQILRRMLAAEKEPQAGEAFRDGRGDDRLDIDAPLEQSLTEGDGADRSSRSSPARSPLRRWSRCRARRAGKPRRRPARFRAGGARAGAPDAGFRAPRARRRRSAAACRRCRRIRRPRASGSR